MCPGSPSASTPPSACIGLAGEGTRSFRKARAPDPIYVSFAAMSTVTARGNYRDRGSIPRRPVVRCLPT